MQDKETNKVYLYPILTQTFSPEVVRNPLGVSQLLGGDCVLYLPGFPNRLAWDGGFAVSRIALVKPEKARAVEDVVLRAVQSGQITEKVRRREKNQEESVILDTVNLRYCEIL